MSLRSQPSTAVAAFAPRRRRFFPLSVAAALKPLGKKFERTVRQWAPRKLRDCLRPVFFQFKAGWSRQKVSPAAGLHGALARASDIRDHAVPRIVLLVADAAHRSRLAEMCRADWCRLEDPSDYRPVPSDYVAFPAEDGRGLTPDELRSAYLALTTQFLDLVIVSRGLEPAPAVRTASLRNHAVVRADLMPFLVNNATFSAGVSGRIIRSACMGPGAYDQPTVDLSELLGQRCTTDGQQFVTGSGGRNRADERLPAWLPLDMVPTVDERPTVLVLPALFAVGGVERNTVEILRALASRYRFVVATTEPLEPSRGSLHHQLEGLCEGIYDLGEIAPPAAHLDLLRRLDERHGFDCIWIVNGSVWLSENLATLRRTFSDVPIIDQQVYDTDHGWISNYRSPAIKSLDGHVAINRRIAECFERRHGIASERIRLIYHAIDAEKWEAVARDRDRGKALKKSWAVPDGSPLYGCIGRLTDQKRPLAFLDLARRAKAEGIPGVFALVGDGELAGKCREFVREHDLTNVRMPGFVDDPADLHAALSGLVITSAYEGLPIVSLEAMAVGTPILATDVGDLRVVGETHGSVSIFTSDDEEGRYADFLRWRAEFSRHETIACEAAASVRAAFGVDVIAAQYTDLFDRAMAVRRRRRPCRPGGGFASVSIVMPTFNRHELLETVLKRYAEYMTGLDCELIVIDDGSKDGTRRLLDRVAREDDRVRFISQSNRGPAWARNVGASMARKDVVLFVGDDIVPCDSRFVRVHARLHAEQADDGFAVLGKVVWPTGLQCDVTPVMRHIQGYSGEQFGYAHFRPYSILDWRFFYTCNVSVKRRIVGDWLQDGFSSDFPSAAFEDIEFAYRMSCRPAGLRIYFDPAARGDHHHVHTVRTFIDRQFAAGMMAAIFVRKHPAVARDLGLEKLIALMKRQHDSARGLLTGDMLSVIEGAKSFAVLLEARGGLGDAHWHTGYLQALFEMVMQQGFVAGWASHAVDVDAGYEGVLSGFLRRVEPLAAIEAPGLHGDISRFARTLHAA